MGRLTFLGERLAASSPFAVHHALNGYRNPVISPETRFPRPGIGPDGRYPLHDCNRRKSRLAQPRTTGTFRNVVGSFARFWPRVIVGSLRSFRGRTRGARRIDSFRNVVGSFARFLIRGYRGFVRAVLFTGHRGFVRGYEPAAEVARQSIHSRKSWVRSQFLIG